MSIVSNIVVGNSETYLLKDYFLGVAFQEDLETYTNNPANQYKMGIWTSKYNNSNVMSNSDAGIVAKQAGFYICIVKGNVQISGEGYGVISIFKNGNVIYNHSNGLYSRFGMSLSLVLKLNANDVVNLGVKSTVAFTASHLSLIMLSMSPDLSPVPSPTTNKAKAIQNNDIVLPMSINVMEL